MIDNQDSNILSGSNVFSSGYQIQEKEDRSKFLGTYTEDPVESLFYTNDFSNFNVNKSPTKDSKNCT
jgi:hypothetical protein